MSDPAEINVLHVDDEQDFAELAAEMLERENDRFTVQIATSASEGVDQLTDTDFDCVVSDFDMPGQNGIEFLETVREGYPDLPFILFTGKGSEEVASGAISAGVTDYLQKGSGTDQYTVLANRICNVVESYRSQQRLAERNRDLSRYKHMINSMHEAACIYDENGRFVIVNEYLANWYDTTRDVLEGEDSNLIPSIREQTEHGDPFQELLDGERDQLSGEIEADFSNHGYALVEYQLTPLRVDGTIEGIVGVARDVTERKQRKQELRRAERRFEAMFNDPNILVGLIDTDGTVIDINETAIGYIDAELSEVRGEPFWDTPWFAGDATIQQEVREWIERAAAGEYVEFEIDLSQAVGDPLVIRGVFRPVRNDAGEVVSLLISDRDITERRARKRELQRYEAYLEKSTDVVTVLDDAGTITYQSPAVEQILGYERDEFIGQNGFDYIHPDDVEDVYAMFTELVEDPGSTVTVECRFKTADDQWRWLEVRGSNRLEHDPINGIVTNNRDITERKQQQQELEETNRLLSTLFETLPVGVTVLNCEGEIVRANRRAEDVLGLTESDIVGRTYSDPEWEIRDENGEQIPPDDLPFARVMDTDDPIYNYEHGIEWPDGKERWLSINAAPVTTDGGETEQVLATITDATDSRRYQEAIEAQNEQLEEFASIVSHDLRNPLNVAAGRLELAREECDSDHLDAIERSHGRIDALITDLLTLARNGEAATDREPVNLTALAKGCWVNVETADATLVTNTERAIYADESRLKQLFENLIRNAVEHGGEDVTVTIGELDDGFYVEDDGPGIPENERDDVFQMGYSTSVEGTGFGLSIVQQIVEAHGWKVSIADGSDGGARFEITGIEFVTE